jgi:hypothetical protein
MKRPSWLLMAVLAVTAVLFSSPLSGRAASVIGNWESGTPEGWIDWSNGQAPLAAPRFEFNSVGATLGSGAVQFNLPGGNFTQWASLKLQMSANGIDEWRDEFLASSLVAADITLVASEMSTAAANNYASIGLNANADGWGFTGLGNPVSVTPFTGYNGDNSFNPLLLSGTQTSTWTWNIQQTHDGIGTDINPATGYIELIFDTYSNGGVVYHIDNVRLIPVPEPASFGLLAMVGPSLLFVLRRRGA